MKRILLAATLMVAAPAATWADPQDFDQVERGRYLTTMGDCIACHTAPGGKPFAGGRDIETPFGHLLSPNLTSDQATGIGAWTDDEFVRAMHEGVDREGRHLYPAFPYVYYTHVTREDALAIRAYLATVPPMVNKVVTNQLPFPMDVRASLRAWNELNFKPGDFKPDATRSADWNRGNYIVNGLGHCGLCHTPKNVSGGDETGRFLQGELLQGWYAPNITGDNREGIGAWSVDDIAEYLRTGHNAIAAASGPMAEEVEQSSYGLADADLHAIAVYLKDVPGQGRAVQPADPNSPAMQAGAVLYGDQCSACHTRAGVGVDRLFPALAHAPVVQQPNAASLVRVVLQGAQSAQTPGAPTGPAMPAFGWKLSDGQVADVVTYIRNAWGNAGSAVPTNDVRSQRAGLTKRTE